jgi:hypothetical protein
MAQAELSGLSIVGAGSFTPAIFHPSWLLDRKLIADNMAEHAMRPGESQQMIVTPQVTVFVADWLSVQVTPEQAVFSTVELGREPDLRDFAYGVFDLLPETPVAALGINADTHFRVASSEAWHAFGDRFLPKDFWEPLFEGDSWNRRPDGHSVGMRIMMIEVHRADADFPGFITVQVAPSVRVVPLGVYVGINAHFQLKGSDSSGTRASDAARTLQQTWNTTRALENQLVERLLEAI